MPVTGCQWCHLELELFLGSCHSWYDNFLPQANAHNYKMAAAAPAWHSLKNASKKREFIFLFFFIVFFFLLIHHFLVDFIFFINYGDKLFPRKFTTFMIDLVRLHSGFHPWVGWTFLGPVENNMGKDDFVSGTLLHSLLLFTFSHLESSGCFLIPLTLPESLPLTQIPALFLPSTATSRSNQAIELQVWHYRPLPSFISLFIFIGHELVSFLGKLFSFANGKIPISSLNF